MRATTGLILLLASLVAVNAQRKSELFSEFSISLRMLICRLMFNITNVFVLLAGIVIAGVGYGSANMQVKQLSDLIGESNSNIIKTYSILIATAGIVIIGIAIYGAVCVNCDFGVAKFVYIVVMGVLAITMLILGVLAYVALAKVGKKVPDAIKYKIENAPKNPPGSLDFPPLDDLQSALKCCGVSYEDVYKNRTKVELPKSCCPTEELEKHKNVCSKDWQNNAHCDVELVKTISKVPWWLAFVLLDLAVLHVGGADPWSEKTKAVIHKFEKWIQSKAEAVVKEIKTVEEKLREIEEKRFEEVEEEAKSAIDSTIEKAQKELDAMKDQGPAECYENASKELLDAEWGVILDLYTCWNMSQVYDDVQSMERNTSDVITGVGRNVSELITGVAECLMHEGHQGFQCAVKYVREKMKDIAEQRPLAKAYLEKMKALSADVLVQLNACRTNAIHQILVQRVKDALDGFQKCAGKSHDL